MFSTLHHTGNFNPNRIHAFFRSSAITINFSYNFPKFHSFSISTNLLHLEWQRFAESYWSHHWTKVGLNPFVTFFIVERDPVGNFSRLSSGLAGKPLRPSRHQHVLCVSVQTKTAASHLAAWHKHIEASRCRHDQTALQFWMIRGTFSISVLCSKFSSSHCLKI